MLRVGSSYGYPIFIHRGSDNNYPEPCDCSSSRGFLPLCDDFDFFAGFAVFDINANRTTVDKKIKEYPLQFRPFLPLMELLYVEPTVSILTGNKKVFESAFASVKQGSSDRFTNESWRLKHYEWCLTKSFGYCTIIIWESSDPISHIVSDNLYDVSRGACADSMSTPFINQLLETPYGALEEAYYKVIYFNVFMYKKCLILSY